MTSLLEHYQEIAAAAEAAEAVEAAQRSPAPMPSALAATAVVSPTAEPSPAPASLDDGADDFQLDDGADDFQLDDGADDHQDNNCLHPTSWVPTQFSQHPYAADAPAEAAGPDDAEARGFTAGLEPTEPFVDRQHCAHALACRLAAHDDRVEPLIPLLEEAVPSLLQLALEAEVACDGVTLGVVLSCLTNMSFGDGTAVVMRHGAAVGELIARCVVADTEPAIGYALACASNLCTQPALLRALDEADGAEAVLRRTAKGGLCDGASAHYAKAVLDGLRNRRELWKAAAPPPPRKEGLAAAASFRSLQSPRMGNAVAATVRRVSSFGRRSRPSSAVPMPKLDSLAGAV